MNFVDKLFSIRKNGIRTHLTILGIKFSYRSKTLGYQYRINAAFLHSQVFPKYKNCNAGKDVVILATGPTLADFEPIDNAVYIGVNRAFQYNKVKLDYAFIFDNSFPTSEYLEELNQYEGNKCKKFYGISSDYDLQNCTISESDAIKANAERFYLYPVKEKNMLTYNIATEAFYNSNSVVFPAIQFALWTNPKRIYLVGCDTNLNGYYNATNTKNILKTDKIYKGWLKVRDFVKIFYPDTEIISINPVGLKGIFKDIYTK